MEKLLRTTASFLVVIGATACGFFLYGVCAYKPGVGIFLVSTALILLMVLFVSASHDLKRRKGSANGFPLVARFAFGMLAPSTVGFVFGFLFFDPLVSLVAGFLISMVCALTLILLLTIIAVRSRILLGDLRLSNS